MCTIKAVEILAACNGVQDSLATPSAEYDSSHDAPRCDRGVGLVNRTCIQRPHQLLS